MTDNEVRLIELITGAIVGQRDQAVDVKDTVAVHGINSVLIGIVMTLKQFKHPAEAELITNLANIRGEMALRFTKHVSNID